MTFSRLWARITGADKGDQFPNQQISMMGRIGDFIIIHPYGLYADLPNDVALQGIANGRVIPVTTTRPSDVARGEPVFFHPATNTRIIARANGDLDIDTVDASGNVNVNCVDANVNASGDVGITAVGDITLIGANVNINP